MRNKDKYILALIIAVAVVIVAFSYYQITKIQTVPYQPQPSTVQQSGSGGTANQATNPTVSPSSGSNSSGANSTVQSVPTTGVQNSQPSSQPTQQAAVSTAPTPQK